ncbi:MAG: hypothetical protein ACXWB4_06025 [Kaistella sp.]
MYINKKNQEKAQVFWKWFTINQDKFLFLNDVEEEVKEALLDEFLEQLHVFNENLYFEIGGHPDDSKVELIISAEGNVQFFPEVELLTELAPTFKNWEIIAFKPPMGSEFTIGYADYDFTPEETVFIPLVNENDENSGIGLRIFYPDFTEEESVKFYAGTYLMLDVILGEKSAALDIDYLEVVKTHDDIEDYNFMYLSELKEYVDEHNVNKF